MAGIADLFSAITQKAKEAVTAVSDGDFNQAQQDYLSRQPNILSTVPNVNSSYNDDITHDYFSQQSNLPATISPDSSFIDAMDNAREDYLNNEANHLIPEINFPSLDSINQAREDFTQREQDQKINQMRRPGLTTGEDLDAYNKFFEERGGFEEGYVPGINDVLSGITNLALTNSAIDRGEMYEIDPSGDILSGLDKMSKENFDDGTMRRDSVKAKYMDLPTYKAYVEAGFGGRSLDELNKLPEGTVFNKLDEAQNYGFRPYIEDESQFANWMATQAGDDTTKAFNILSDARDLMTDASIKFNGDQYSRDDFYNNIADYFKDIDNLIGDDKIEMYDVNDPNADPENDMPMTIWWSFPGTDITVPSDQELQYQWSNDGDILYVWLPGHEDQAVEYYGIEDYEENLPQWNTYRSEEGDPIHKYWHLPKLEYTQQDGKQVSLPYDSVEEITQSMANGTADMDWGPFNIAKDANDRKGFGDMFTTGDFSDIVPNMVDLTTGSAPLFSPYTAWPMAISNAVTATQGLDPRLYDEKTNTFRRLSDDMNGEKYLSNIALSGLVPATERVAGVIGGSGGLLGKPIQAALKKVGAPAIARSAVDVLGEGAEESVASTWEDYQVNGLNNWFANPLYETDEYGNIITEYDPVTKQDKPKIKYDNSGHEMRDSSTPVNERFGNWLDQQLDNVLAGTALGLGIGGPRIASDAITGSGYYGESRERKMLRDLEKMNNLPRFREAKKGNARVTITPEDIGTYGKRDE